MQRRVRTLQASSNDDGRTRCVEEFIYSFFIPEPMVVNN